MCVAHGGAMRREPPQRSEDIESIAALAVIIPLTAKRFFTGYQRTLLFGSKRAFSMRCYRRGLSDLVLSGTKIHA